MAGGIGGRLTDKACKAFAAQKAHGRKLSDGGGLYLFITPAGGAVWRIKYRIDGKEKTYSIGSYPAISLAAARTDLAEVKALLRENKDPVTQRRINRAESSSASENEGVQNSVSVCQSPNALRLLTTETGDRSTQFVSIR